MDLLKELALVSHSFHRNKHLFSTVELYDIAPRRQRTFSKKGFVELLKSRPYIVKYIRNIRYVASGNSRLGKVKEDQLLSSILPNFLKTIPHLKSLEISSSKLYWNRLDSSLASAFLYLMHLPTINHINLSYISNFPLSSLIPCVNLHQLDISYLKLENSFPEIIQSEMPRIRQLYTSGSTELTNMMLRAKRRDGHPAFDFTDLRQLSMSFTQKDNDNARHLLQTAKLLDKLHLIVDQELALEGLHDILSPSARTLKTLELTIHLCHAGPPFAGLCKELEAMAGHNVLEVLAFRVDIDQTVEALGSRIETADFIGSRIETVDKVLVKPGWSTLKQISVDISILCCLLPRETSAEWVKALQCLPDKYLSHLSNLESVTLNWSAYIMECGECII